MSKLAFPVALLVLVAGAVAPTHADIYTWTDKNGVVNVSNLPPPEGVRPTRVTHEAPKDPAREAAARDAAQLAELRALNERVAQLQEQVEQSRRETPPPMVVVAPPMMPYAAPAAPYIVNVVTQSPPAYGSTGSGCDYGWGDWGDCGGFGVWPGYYGAGVVAVPRRNHGGRRFGPPQVQNPIVPPLIPPPRMRPVVARGSKG